MTSQVVQVCGLLLAGYGRFSSQSVNLSENKLVQMYLLGVNMNNLLEPCPHFRVSFQNFRRSPCYFYMGVPPGMSIKGPGGRGLFLLEDVHGGVT